MLLSKNKKLRLAWGALETVNPLYLKLLLKNPSALRWFPGRIFRNYMRLAGRDQWTCRGIFEVFPAENVRFTVDVTPREGVGERLDWVTYLAYITRVVQPSAIFEIGTFRGRTTINFALNSPDHCRVYTLDLPPASRNASAVEGASVEDRRLMEIQEVGVDYLGKTGADKITQLYGDSRTFDYSPYRGKIDLVFVDAAHHYAAVKSDTENALAMLKPGGWLIWDNFSQYGDYHDVTRAVLDMFPRDRVVQLEDTELAVHQKDR